ncbi:MAG TPA: nicotinamidase [Vicinamibacterales bacterium]|nr:nicotinamidase [Vicinamibacterales bacterium]
MAHVAEPDRTTTALLVVDLQHDFLPGGALGVAGADELLAPIAGLMRERAFGVCVATQDWHPPGHVSFASAHPGRRPLDVITLYDREQTLWPDHCVQDSPGAALHPDLPWRLAAAIVRKGMDPACDSYSALRNNWQADGRRPPTGLGGYLRELGVRDVYICGLTREFCGLWTAEDAAAAGFAVHVLWDLMRPVDPRSDDEVRTRLARAGATVVTGSGL